jgi:hypothetical protein
MFRNFLQNECPICEENKAGTDCQLQYSGNNPRFNSFIRCHNSRHTTKFPDWIDPEKGDPGQGWSAPFRILDLTSELQEQLFSISTQEKSGAGFTYKKRGQKRAARTDNVNYFPTVERDFAIRSMAAVTHMHPVNGVHVDLVRRGLTPDQIKKHPFLAPYYAANNMDTFGFEGFPQNSAVGDLVKYYWRDARQAFMQGTHRHKDKSNYYFIPAYNFAGQVHGGQLGLDPSRRAAEEAIAKAKGKDVAKYKFITDVKISETNIWSSKTEEYAEHPLTILRATKSSNVVLLCEGILKPIVAYERLSCEYHVMGAIGGQFLVSRENFEANLTLLREREDVDTVLFAVDKNWASEKKSNVHSGVARALMVAEELGFKVSILDFGQALGEKDDVDTACPDEIKAAIKPFITAPKNLLEDIVLSSVLPAPKNLFYTIDELVPLTTIDQQEEAFPYYENEAKVVFDLRPMGAGKSHLVPSVRPAKPEGRVIYVSQSPRMAPTPEIHRDFIQMPSRHSGLIEQVGRTNVVGEPLMLRPKPTDDPSKLVGATCAIPEVHVSAAKLGIHGSTVCRSCPHFAACKSGDGSFTYLSDKKKAMVASKIITAIDALNPASVTDADTIIIDEVVASVPFVTNDTFKVLHIRAYINDINRLATGMDLVMSGYKLTYKLSTEALLSAAKALDMSLTKRIEGQLGAGVPANTMPARAESWVKAMLESNAIFDTIGDSIVIQHRTHKIKELVEAAGKVVLLDATSSPTVLAVQYGLDPADCVAFTQHDKATESVKITVLRTEGFNGRAESASRKSVCVDIRNYFAAKYGDAVGYASHREYAKSGDVIFFSDSRGSNKMLSKSHLVIQGMPNPSIVATQAEFSLISSALPGMDFNTYYNYKAHAELKQTIGRLRGFRRDMPLHAWVVANVHLTTLSDEGYDVTYRYADWFVGSTNNTNSQRTLSTMERIVEGIKTNAGDTLAAICKSLALRKDTVERTLKRMGVSFDAIVKACTQIIVPGLWVNYFPGTIVSAAKHAVATDGDIDFQEFNPEDVVVAAEALAQGHWPSGAKREDVKKIQEAFGLLAGVRHTQQWEERVKTKILVGIENLCSAMHTEVRNAMQVVRKYANETLLTDITEVSIIEAWFAEEEAHPCTYPSMFTCPT